MNTEDFYKDIPIELFNGNIENLGFMSEEEAVEYTLNKFMEGVQEINREINTIGSKNQFVEVGNMVVSAKNALENIREQARNVE